VKFLFDFFPLIFFWIAFKASDIFIATAVAIVATVVQIGWVLARGRRVTKLQWTSLAIIVVFGGATLILHDETYIKWKPTVLYWIMGGSLLVALAFNANFVKALIGQDLEMPESVWTKVAIAWGLFFLFQGALNLWVAFNFSLDTWATFKVFGGVGLIFAFALAQAFCVAKYVQEEPAKIEPPSP
jgi:intracellular septation protein